LRDSKVQEQLAAQGVAARGSTPAEMRDLLERDIDKWPKVIRDAKIEPPSRRPATAGRGLS